MLEDFDHLPDMERRLRDLIGREDQWGPVLDPIVVDPNLADQRRTNLLLLVRSKRQPCQVKRDRPRARP